ncbi:hypothetical protein LCGC14_1814470 [marine sediment metagenome]|uniref:Glucose-6-phosphate dehydrogenase NAD-binding domain-containing protein n=1 Tax=marine sediment metagenome TaxID=412755 RepID=A0A0F9GKM8_9ZZZZ
MVSRVIPVDTFDLVIFGGTGDLARRKILPGLYRRFIAGQMPEDARIIGAARSDMDDAGYRKLISDAIDEFIPRNRLDSKARDAFLERLHYVTIDATAQGDALGKGILEEAEPGAAHPPRARRRRGMPIDAPGFALAPPMVRAFNAAYYGRIPARGRSVVRSMHQFHFPLDRMQGWNRLYGKPGFYQFQCALPHDGTAALRDILGRVAASGLASPLAVLKRLGPGRAGMMSFPLAGHTLAIDMRNTDATRILIRQLHADVAAAGGRIYLAKDALAKAETVHAMYPELGAWRREVALADPHGAYTTDLVRRLQLRDSA